MENVNLKTREKVNELLSKIGERNKKVEVKISELEKEKLQVIEEKKELEVELISNELDGDGKLRTRINSEIEKRISKLIAMDGKLEALKEYKNNYYNDTDEILKIAAIEYIEDRCKYEDNLQKELEKVHNEIEKLELKLRQNKEIEDNIIFKLYRSKPYDAVGEEILKVLEYTNPKYKEEINSKLDKQNFKDSLSQSKVIHEFLKANYKQLKNTTKKKSFILEKYLNSN